MELVRYGSYFLETPAFANRERFLEAAEQLGDERSCFLDSIEGLRTLSSLLQDRDSFEHPKEILEYLVGRELANIADALESIPGSLEMDVRQELTDNFSMFRDILGEHDLQVADPRLFVVSRFPEPYADMEWAACAPDESDHRKYGIEPGIYFREDKLESLQSSFLLAHEMIHKVTAKEDVGMLGRGLEDGLCDLVGSMYLGLRLGVLPTRNYFLYLALGFPEEQFDEIYLDYLRQAALLYNRTGLTGIFHVLRNGRGFVKRLEGELLRGDFSSLDDIPTGEHHAALSGLLNLVCSAYGRHVVVSPAAFLVADHVREGATVADISARARISSDVVTSALEELQQRVVLLVMAGDRVSVSDLSVVLGSISFRYELNG